MKKIKIIILLFSLSISSLLGQDNNNPITEEEFWRLGWRMVLNSLDENLEKVESQFDSLLGYEHELQNRFLVVGLETKLKLGHEQQVIEILADQPKDVLSDICKKQFLQEMSPCHDIAHEEVSNKELQIELIKMYINDQAARGNMMQDVISEYGIDKSEIAPHGNIDQDNRNRLKEIIKAHGFPTRQLVGKDAMQGIFIMIQHADGDKGWQKSQLSNIELSVKNGDMDGQSYAYLYDRIKINNGEKQLYGTQFTKVDPINKVVKLAETEDRESLDKRRREIGMMPIDMYKWFMLKDF